MRQQWGRLCGFRLLAEPFPLRSSQNRIQSASGAERCYSTHHHHQQQQQRYAPVHLIHSSWLEAGLQSRLRAYRRGHPSELSTAGREEAACCCPAALRVEQARQSVRLWLKLLPPQPVEANTRRAPQVSGSDAEGAQGRQMQANLAEQY